jgi:hypothetical protein
MIMWNLITSFLCRPRMVNLIVAFARRRIYQHIYDASGALYMGRWWVLREHRWFPYAIRLHHIAREDRDRDLHDHPYDYRTIILKGFYVWVGLPGRAHVLIEGDTDRHGAEHFHKITQVSEGGVWTLFIYRCRSKSNPWGFLTLNGHGAIRKVPWRDYLDSVRATQE